MCDLGVLQKIQEKSLMGESGSGLQWSHVATTGAHQPGAISHHSSVVFHEKMYLFGGSIGNSDPNERMYSLDLKSNKWEVVEH